MAGSDRHDPKILTVSEVLDAPDLPEEVVEVPEWGGSVRVRALSLDEIFEIHQATGDDQQRANLLGLVKGIVEPSFTEEHLVLLKKKNAGVILRITRAITRLSGMGEEVVAQAKAAFPARAR